MNTQQPNYVTHECNSCYETKPCTVEEEDLKDGEEYHYCDECRTFWAEDANPRPQTTEEIAEMDRMKELADQFTAGKITMEQARKMYKKE